MNDHDEIMNDASNGSNTPQTINNNTDNDDEIIDETEFIDLTTAVEIPISDDVEPIESDDDDDDNAPTNNDEDTPMDNDVDKINDDSNVSPPAATTTTNEEDTSQIQISCHSDAVYSLAYEPSLKLIVSGGGDDCAFLSSLSSLSSVLAGTPPTSRRLEREWKDTVSCLKFNSHCGAPLSKKMLAVGCYDGSIVVFDETGTEVLAELEGPSDVEWIDWHPKGGSVLLAGSTDGTIWMYHLTTTTATTPLPHKVLQVFVGHQNDVTCGGFTPDGKFVLSGGADATIRIWAPKTGACKATLSHRDTDNFGSSPSVGAGVTCCAMKGQVCLAGTEDGEVLVVGTGSANRKILGRLRHGPEGSSVESVAFFDGGDAGGYDRWCASGGSDGTVKIWDLGSESCRHVCGAAGGSVVTRLFWHPTFPMIVSGSGDGGVRFWDARSGVLLESLKGKGETINDLVVDWGNGDGNAVVVTACEDGVVRVWEVDVGGLIRSVAGE